MKKLHVYLTILFIVLLQCLIAPGAGATEPAPNEVILYEARDFIGDSQSIKLPPGVPYWGMPVGNKIYGKVSSIRIGSEVGVRLFRQANFHEGKPYKIFRDNTLFQSHNLLSPENFYNALIIFETDYHFVGAIVLTPRGSGKNGCRGNESSRRWLILYPPLISSNCFDLQDDLYFKFLRIGGIPINNHYNNEHKVKVKVFRQHSCTGKSLSFPGPSSNKSCFNLEDYTFSEKDRPQSVFVTYEGPYNHYHSKVHTKAPESKEPQWIEEDTDRPGKNFRNFWMLPPGSKICREACEKDADCKAYTYVPPDLSGDPSKGRCWLKNGVPQPVSREGMVSGVKRFFDHAKKAPTGPATGPGILLPPKVGPGKAGVAQADAVMSFRLVETKGDHLTFEVDYSVEPYHGNTVYLGGWIYDNKGQAISGYKPISVAVPGPGKARLEVTLDSGQGHRGKEIEFFLSEPNKGPFIKKRFPLNMRLPAAPTQPPKFKTAPGYVVAPGAKAQGDQQVDLSGTWNSNIGLVYQISQSGNKLSYQDPLMHKPVNGTVDGKTVTVSWTEGNAVKNLKGTITSVGNDSKAKRIEWKNSVVFHR